MIFDRLERHRDLGLLIARVGFGLAFFWFHGWPKIIGGPEMWTGVGSAVGNFGIDFGHQWFGLAAGIVESLGGLCIAAGLFFRPASLLLAGVMLVAAVNHIATGQGTPAHAIKNMFVALGFVFIGPGRYSLDHLISAAAGRAAPNEAATARVE